MTDEDTATVQRVAAARRGLGRTGKRRRSALELWAWEPIVILRASLVINYLVGIDFAVLSLVAGVPVFEVVFPRGLTAVWAALLLAACSVALVAAISDRLEPLEKWSSLAVLSLYGAYVFGLHVLGFATGDPNRQAVSAASIFGLILPVGRFLWLAAQTGKRKLPLDDRGRIIT